jgi:CDP-glucose 4,6-dehydratase
MFANSYAGRTVLVTGHTGFKGSWLTAWLLRLGARVVGFSRDVPTTPAMFNALSLSDRIVDIRQDVRDSGAVCRAVDEHKPDFVFHLAAQAIVSSSYAKPAETVETNVIGTMNVLEALRTGGRQCTAVLVTSDKCYDNVEWVWGYRENDRLGGKDVYSGSKGAAELVIKSYCRSFFGEDSPVRVGVGRAGNVIGGGDWAPDRIVADCMRSWRDGRRVSLRSPQATRPWQHVLEPLSGYLTLAASLSSGGSGNGEAFNFGPEANQNRTVQELISDLALVWGFDDASQSFDITGTTVFPEAGLLKLNCDKALSGLGWRPVLTYDETVRMVGEWYASAARRSADAAALTDAQITLYMDRATERGRHWAVQP